MLLYLHGYASTGGGGKYSAMRDAFPDARVLSPTLPHDPLETARLITDLVEQESEPTVVVGTSLGGFYAAWCASQLGCPAVIINPAMEPWISLREELGPTQRFDSPLHFTWRSEHLDGLEELGRQLAQRPPDGALVHLHLSRDDELLDHEQVPGHFDQPATVQWWDGSGHRFSRFEELLPALGRLHEEKLSSR